MIKICNKIYSIGYLEMSKLESCTELMLNKNLKSSKNYTVNFNDSSISTSKEKTHFDCLSESEFLEILEK
jgi:hypothetical protein